MLLGIQNVKLTCLLNNMQNSIIQSKRQNHNMLPICFHLIIKQQKPDQNQNNFYKPVAENPMKENGCGLYKAGGRNCFVIFFLQQKIVFLKTCNV